MLNCTLRFPMTKMNDIERRAAPLFRRFFDNQPVSRVFAVNMTLVAFSNIISDAGNVNRALINIWGLAPVVVHVYMAGIILASAAILIARKTPPAGLYLAGISYVLLILGSVFALAVVEPGIDTFSAALRIGGLESLSLYMLIKLLRIGDD